MLQMVDVTGQYRRYQTEIDRAILDVVKSGAYINGPVVKQFERDVEKYLGVKHAIGCASGTDALQIALMALGIGPGDEVITTTFTFVATTETIALLGAKPVYVDIDPKTFNLDVAQLQDKITARTRAIIPVHLFGQPCNITAVMEIANKNGVSVIEDAAQAMGATWDGKKVCGFGDISAISFYPSKNLGAFGDAGMMVTNDDGLAERMRSIANHGANKTYHHDRLGVNSRLDSILGVKLQSLDEWNATRARAAALYSTLFAAHAAKIQTPFVDPRAKSIWHQYSLLIFGDRDAVATKLKLAGVPHSIYYPIPLHLQPAYAAFGSRAGDFHVAEHTAKHILALPMHSELTGEDVEYIADRVIEAIKN
jgi:UDP-2-acetamido-2-deoxy-ribo-hexuluronate aminotransferase